MAEALAPSGRSQSGRLHIIVEHDEACSVHVFAGAQGTNWQLLWLYVLEHRKMVNNCYASSFL